ncbi:hypothetical protein C7B77_04000 [Chamaesiphon polymorphus CCALA 037]|uniref:Uncharacterized protein n=1 Tax=Chamaesiphon polymorphus CCALA 037 TaxID=2107692 RepID=A0A2T1GLF4_9CYAN|nr:hypothetical protein C7B77_04000 [Chamaesiphon polymorphus CCALA 037]
MNAIKTNLLIEIATASRSNGADERIDVLEVGGCQYFPVRVADEIALRFPQRAFHQAASALPNRSELHSHHLVLVLQQLLTADAEL